jgi:UDP-N-acetylmuramate dehydrogenase
MGADEVLREGLRNQIAGEILFDEPADAHTSIGVGGRIDALAFPESEEELAHLTAFLRERHTPFLPVGNWTNLIVRDGGYRGVLISLGRMRGLNLVENGDGGVLVKAEAGVALSELVNLSVRESLTGMEFCAGIPGSVGGAIRMNAGAYGSEIKDVVAVLRLFDPSGGFRTANKETLRFSYRNLDLHSETIIVGAVFKLQRGDGEAIAERVREIIAGRRENHPIEFRNAGSIFKNPREIPAGRLIEEVGLKGIRIGDAQISENHGNFIVNRGHATAGEILRLITLIQQRVLEATGHLLETEVKIIGE